MKSSDTLRWLWQVPGRKKGLIALLTAVQMLLGGYGVMYAVLLKNAVNGASDHNAEEFRRWTLLILLLMAGQLALQAAVRWLNELSRATLENAFKQRLTDNILRKQYSSVSSVHTAEWMNRLTNDAAVVADGCTDILPGLTGTAVRLVSALVMLVAMDRRFAMILIPGGLALILLSYAFRRVLRRLHRNIQESDGRLRMFLQERIGGLNVIKAFSAEQRTSEETAALLEDHKSARMRRNRFSNLCNVGFGAAMRGLYLFGILYSAYGILTDTVSYGTMTAVMQLVGQVQAPFANISGYLPRWYSMTASAERLMEIESLPDDITSGAPDQEQMKRFYRDKLENFGLRNVSFSYPGDSMPQVLRDVTIDIKKGETVAFSGRSGCGKSTVLKLLMCLYEPDSGEMYLNDSPLTSAHRRLFAYVPQGETLMKGTIREAVCFGDPAGAADEERFREALRIACADSFVYELENGADTMLGERGAGLSEGQMQRLAVARAFFTGSPVLLLDEATSALDAETERQLLDNLRKLTDRTVITVTHRQSVLSVCDRVIRFSKGGAAET